MTSVIMPKTGMAMEQGTIVRWLKRAGDAVRKGEAIAEIETDKSTMELEAEADGALISILHGDGETVSVSVVIAWIGQPGEQAPAAEGRVPATPAARQAAREARVDLASVPASGKHGEVRRPDVLASAAPVAAPAAAPTLAPTLAIANGDTRVPLSSIQKITGRRMQQSHLEIPAVTCQTRADVTELLAMRERINEGAEAKVTINDMVVRAAAKALAAHPRVNSVLDGAEVIYRKAIDIGLAVATPQGLLVPVVRAADTLTLAALAARTHELAAKAREKTLAPAELEGGSFTVSNLGMYGITGFTPIINQPQAAILGVCAVEESLALVGGALTTRKLMGLSLTFDHRILDGAEAALFLKGIKDSLENPLMVLV